jgi:hypothetical protein
VFCCIQRCVSVELAHGGELCNIFNEPYSKYIPYPLPQKGECKNLFKQVCSLLNKKDVRKLMLLLPPNSNLKKTYGLCNKNESNIFKGRHMLIQKGILKSQIEMLQA